MGTPVEVVGEFEEHRAISGGTGKLDSPKLYIREALSPNPPLVSRVVYTATLRKVPTHNFTLWHSFCAHNENISRGLSIRTAAHNIETPNPVPCNFPFTIQFYSHCDKMWIFEYNTMQCSAFHELSNGISII